MEETPASKLSYALSRRASYEGPNATQETAEECVSNCPPVTTALAALIRNVTNPSRRLRKNAAHQEQSTAGAEAHTDSTCLTLPWKGRSSKVVHALVVFPQPARRQNLGCSRILRPPVCGLRR